ncbi:MAG TPA: tetratricopeptide repeat protein [Candidatus Rifleibacterium sp.]|nr:tetratricopeptide repeat protein [Candidatus Rifleibacterium sp.]HPT44486.1 tetratricopeptide repeat protein [Candidatus Rifleibacterium sp.]
MKYKKSLVAALICTALTGANGTFAAINLDSELENGKKLMKSGDYKKSAELFNQLLTQNKEDIKSHPKHAEMWYLFSLSLRQLGRTELADKALARAKTLKKLLETTASATETATGSLSAPESPGEAVSAMAEPDKGADATESASINQVASSATAVTDNDLTSLKTEKAREHSRQANALFESGQYQASADAYLLAIEAEPGNIELLEKTLICLTNVGSGYYQKAISVYAALEQADPAKMTASHQASYARACIFANKPDYKKAATILTALLKAAPENVEAMILSAQLDSENKLYKQAIEKYEKAIKLDKNALQAYLGLGEAYQKMQQFPKAIEVLQKARDLWPESFMPLVGLGKAYLKNNNHGQALVMFNIAFEMNPDNFDVNLGLLEILASKGDYRSNDHLARCEKSFRGDPRVEYWKAVFMELDERLEDAKRIYSLLALYEDDIAYRARLRLGQIYGGIGHETFPGNLLIIDRPYYQRVYSSINDQELAYSHLSAFLAKKPDAPEAQSVRQWLDANEDSLRKAREFDALVQSQFKTE